MAGKIRDFQLESLIGLIEDLTMSEESFNADYDMSRKHYPADWTLETFRDFLEILEDRHHNQESENPDELFQFQIYKDVLEQLGAKYVSKEHVAKFKSLLENEGNESAVTYVQQLVEQQRNHNENL
jgi:hypothetical protein